MKLLIDALILCGLLLNRDNIDPDIYFIFIMFGAFFLGYHLREVLIQD